MHSYFIAIGNANSIEGLTTDIEVGMKAITRPSFPALKKKNKTYQVDGKDGDYYEDLGYQDRKIDIKYNFYDRKTIHDRVRRIRRFLDNAVGKKLAFSDDPEFFYIIKHLEYGDIERITKRIGNFTVSIIVEPFAYKFATNQFIEINSGDQVYNDGDFKSKPLIEIEGNGYIKLWINNNLIGFNVVDKTLIDCKKELCYREDELTNLKIGNYPILEKEFNNIRWEGNVKKVSLNPNYIYY